MKMYVFLLMLCVIPQGAARGAEWNRSAPTVTVRVATIQGLDRVVQYVAGDPTGISIIDRSDPRAARELGRFAADAPVVGLELHGRSLHVKLPSGAVDFYDVSDPLHPVLAPPAPAALARSIDNRRYNYRVHPLIGVGVALTALGGGLLALGAPVAADKLGGGDAQPVFAGILLSVGIVHAIVGPALLGRGLWRQYHDPRPAH